MKNIGFEYVDITVPKDREWINLFFDGQIVALIRDVELAKKIKERIDNASD